MFFMRPVYCFVFLCLFGCILADAGVDTRFTNYEEMSKVLGDLVVANPKIARLFSVGRSYEGRQIWGVELTGNMQRLKRFKRQSTMPGAVFIGNLRAREHLSAEIPLLLLQHLAKNYGVDANITKLIDERDLFFIPMANPDGAEYDIREDKYWDHVKNARRNGTRNPGVDLGSNFGYAWGNSGSSADPGSDVFRGPAAFSEPETIALANFFKSHRANLKLFMNITAFGEYVLYPWSSSFSKVGKQKDYKAYTAIARTLALQNKYSVAQSSDVYIASGDIADWVYSATGILSFTIRLSPADVWSGGYYPSAAIIDKVFEDNLKAMLHFIEMADNPYKTL